MDSFKYPTLLATQMAWGRVNEVQHTLPRNDLLCYLNWGAQVLVEISLNVKSASMAIEKRGGYDFGELCKIHTRLSGNRNTTA